MRFGVALTALACLLLVSCAARPTRPVERPPAATAVCPPESPLSHWREMTWPEYYTDVEQTAWRRGGRVIWIDPPHVAKVSGTSNAAVRSCQR